MANVSISVISILQRSIDCIRMKFLFFVLPCKSVSNKSNIIRPSEDKRLVMLFNLSIVSSVMSNSYNAVIHFLRTLFCFYNKNP